MPGVAVFTDLDMVAVVHRLRAVRKARGLSQTTVALYADISVSYLNDIERNRAKGLPAPTLYKLCMVLNISANYLLGLSSVPACLYGPDVE